MSSRRTASRSYPVNVLHCCAHLGTGGIERILFRTLPAFDRSRIASSVCRIGPRFDWDEQWRAAGLRTHSLGHTRTLHGGRTLLRLVRLLRRDRIELVHSHRPLDRLYAGLAAQVCGIPHVTTLHNTDPPRGLEGPRRRELGASGTVGEFLLRRQPDRYIAVSESVRRAQTEARRLPADKIAVVYHGLRAEAFQTIPPSRVAATREWLGVPDSSPLLLTVGRLDPDKGQKYLIPMMKDVLREHPAAVLLIVGEGEERIDLEKRIRGASLEGRVRLLGKRADVPDLLAAADVFVMPSIREGLGLAAVEACAAAVPVVASRIAALEEVIIDRQTGILVPPEDPIELAAAVRELLKDDTLRASLGSSARDLAKRKFSIDATVKALTATYLDLTGWDPA